MAAISSKDTEIHVATVAAGPYTCVGKVLSVDVTEEGGDAEDLYVFCDDAPITEAGDETSTIEIPVLWDLADTNGQNVLRTARRAASTIYLRLLPGGPSVAGEQRPVKVTRMSWASDPNGTGRARFVTGSFTIRTAGPVTAVAAVP